MKIKGKIDLNGQTVVSGVKSGNYIIALDGELYANRSFNSDSEAIIAAYRESGEKCLDVLDGVYAFAIWDAEARTLFAARDRAGGKPLFYHYDSDNKTISFASDVKELLDVSGIKPVLSANGVAQLTLLGPAREAGNGVFEGISEIKPAHYAVFNRDGLSEKRYWDLTAEPHDADLDETARRVRELVLDSIARQTAGDDDICAFLSGGLDSSVISAVTAKSLAAKGKKLVTYSLDYSGNHENFKTNAFIAGEDTPWIEEMTAFIGSEHRNVILDTPALVNSLSDAAKARGFPGMADVDSSLYLFCGEVAKHFKIALSGECSDELFGGYRWYHDENLLFQSGFPWALSTTQRADLLRENALGGINPAEYINNACANIVNDTSYLDSDDKNTRRHREMFRMNYYGFMQTLVVRNTAMADANGLNVRTPYCDYKIAEYAYNIPWEMKAYNGREKGLLRLAFSESLPQNIVWRKKSPFPKTHNPAYLKAVGETLGEMIKRSDCRITEIYDKVKLEALIENGGDIGVNWYGQLMSAPQILAYLIQFECFLRDYDVRIKS